MNPSAEEAWEEESPCHDDQPIDPLMMGFLCFYMWLYVHRPFEIWTVLATFRLERVVMVAVIGYWLLATRKSASRNRLNFAFASLAIAVLASWLCSSFHEYGQVTVENFFKVGVFYVLVVTSISGPRQLRVLVLAFLISMTLYMSHSLWEYGCGRHVYRMGTARMVGVDQAFNDPNTFAATLLYAAPMVMPFWLESTTWRARLPWLAYLALTAVCILLTGSRAALLGICFLGMLWVLFMVRRRLRLLLILLVAAAIGWQLLPADRRARYLTILDPSQGPKNAQVSAEGRIEGWKDGVMFWQQHPLFGVGPAAFGAARGNDQQSHQLYGQILGELGAIGALAFVAVVWAFLQNWRETRRMAQLDASLTEWFPYQVSISVFAAVVLLLFMGLGGHNLYRYTWLWYGAFQAVALSTLRQRAVDDEEPIPDTSQEYGPGIVY